MFTDIDHIGLVVQDLDEALALYSRAFMMHDWERIAMPDRYMEIAVARVGDTLLEIIAPTSEEASFAKFLQKHGPGMHHVAYRVEDITAALAEIEGRGVELIDKEPRLGMHHTLVAFLHPKSTMGVLIELVQHQ